MSKIEVLEEIDQKDLDGTTWRIERWPDYTMVVFNDYPNLIPNPNIDSIALDETDFESYCKLRKIIQNSSTLQIWNKINHIASVVQKMILESPTEQDSFNN